MHHIPPAFSTRSLHPILCVRWLWAMQRWSHSGLLHGPAVQSCTSALREADFRTRQKNKKSGGPSGGPKTWPRKRRYFFSRAQRAAGGVFRHWLAAERCAKLAVRCCACSGECAGLLSGQKRKNDTEDGRAALVPATRSAHDRGTEGNAASSSLIPHTSNQANERRSSFSTLIIHAHRTNTDARRHLQVVSAPAGHQDHCCSSLPSILPPHVRPPGSLHPVAAALLLARALARIFAPVRTQPVGPSLLWTATTRVRPPAPHPTRFHLLHLRRDHGRHRYRQGRHHPACPGSA